MAQPHDRPRGWLRRGRDTDLGMDLGGGGARRQLYLCQQRDSGRLRHPHTRPLVGAVLAQELETPSVDVLDGNHVKTVRVSVASRLQRRIPQLGGDRDRLRLIIERQQDEARLGALRQDVQ